LQREYAISGCRVKKEITHRRGRERERERERERGIEDSEKSRGNARPSRATSISGASPQLRLESHVPWERALKARGAASDLAGKDERCSRTLSNIRGVSPASNPAGETKGSTGVLPGEAHRRTAGSFFQRKGGEPAGEGRVARWPSANEAGGRQRASGSFTGEGAGHS